MKKSHPCLFPDCGQGPNGSRHVSLNADHDYEGEPKGSFGQQRSTLKPRSDRPNRVRRYEESQRMMQEHRLAVRYCEGPAYGLQTPCGTGPDGTIEQHHRTGRGMGGGKDHGDLASLCRKHHREMDSDRPTARAVGLVKRRPPVDSPPRIRSRFA